MEEIWKDIKGYEELYQVSNLGRIKSLKRIIYDVKKSYTKKEKIRKLLISKESYIRISLCKNGKQKKYCVHRLVAETFILNSNNKTQVNHKDCNKHNNNAKNLEWCTPKENVTHAINNGLCDLRDEKMRRYNIEVRPKKVIQYDLKGNVLNVWNSMTQASNALKIKTSTISSCCKNKPHHNTAGGFKWEYYKNM